MNWIDNKYEIIKHLGGGGFSDVYLVKSPDGEVALKLLKTEVTMSPSEKNLVCFKNEFSILKNLSHPNIARILDFGLDEEHMQYYFTQEHVDGSDIFNGTNGYSLDEINELFVEALRALEYLHSYRIFHFDIKAGNLLLGQNKHLKIIDFGLASIDPKGHLLGTPSYMAPEIVRGEKPDGRADIYSLGILWYYCLTRKNPFRSANPKETLGNQKNMTPPPPSEFNYSIPKYIDKIILRMLEKRPEMRYERPANVIKELNLLGDHNFEMETKETLLSYIPEKGRFIGRKDETEKIKDCIAFVKKSRGVSESILITGETGTGKKRFLDEVKYLGQINDIPVTYTDCKYITTLKETLDDIEKHISSEEGARIFIIASAEKLEGHQLLTERLKNILSMIGPRSTSTSTMVAISGAKKNETLTGTVKLFNHHIHLGNFTMEEMREYLTSLTGIEELPDFLVDEIMKRTEGNPLFVTELAKALITSGTLFDEKGRWKDSSFFDIGIDFDKIFPASLRDLLMKSYFELSADEKKIIDLLAIAKRPSNSFELSLWSETKDIGPVIETLIRRDMISREAGYNFYFRNKLLQGYVNADIAEETKEVYHDRIANYLIESEGGADEIALHTAQGTNTDKAFATAFETGLRYLEQGVGETALKFFEFAERRCDNASNEAKVELKLKIGETYLIKQEYASALEYFNQASNSIRMLEAAGTNIDWQIKNFIKIGGTYIKLTKIDQARESFETAKKLLGQSTDDTATKLVIENWEAYARLQEGKLDEARSIYEKTRSASETLPEKEKIKIKNNELGTVFFESGDLKNAIKTFNEDLDYFTQIDDKLLIARRHYSLANAYLAENNAEEALKHLESTAAISRETKDLELLLCAYNATGNIFNLQTKLDDSKTYYERARELAHQLGDFKSHAAISINIGIIEHTNGNKDLAYYELYPAIVYLQSTPGKSIFDWHTLIRGQIEMNEILIEKGDLSGAEEIISAAKESIGELPKDDPMIFWISLSEANLMKAWGRKEEHDLIISYLKKIASTPEEKRSLQENGYDDSVDNVIPAKACLRRDDSDEEIEDMDNSKRIEELSQRIEEMGSLIKKYEDMMEGSVHGFATVNLYEKIIGKSKVMSDILQMVDKIADTDISVMITGESGTGKELIAKALHQHSSRQSAAFVTINCGAIPGTLIESELFGYKMGAFTGASHDKKGLFEEADGGTIFLDEMTELESALQVKLLRVIQEKEFTRIGDTKLRKSDVRIISATNKDILNEIKEKRFREDLYWRLCQIELHLPPLRKRREDIPLLVKHYLQKNNAENKTLSPSLLKHFIEYDWPGNIREIESLMSVMVALSQNDVIGESAVPSNYGVSKFIKGGDISATGGTSDAEIDESNLYRPKLSWEDYKKLIFAKAYAANDFKAHPTAAELEISPTTMYAKIKEYDLDNRENSLYRDRFQYTRGRTLDSYTLPVFVAALSAARDKPSAAIRNLKISQGFFYRVMKNKH